MASRVNVKFVVLLSTVLVLVAGGAAALALTVLLKSAEDLVKRGDEMFAQGEYKAAEVFYSKAVYKEPYNSAYLLKWRDALESWTPETDQVLETEFRTTYLSLQRQLALSDNRSHPEYQLEFVRLLADLAGMGQFSRRAYEDVAKECDAHILNLQTTQPDHPAIVQLRRERGLAWARIAAEQLELTPEQLSAAEADLAAAISADRTDIDALQSLVSLKLSAADRARESGRRTEATQLENEAMQLIEQCIAANGADTVAGAQAMMLKTESSLGMQRRAALEQLGTAAMPEIVRLAEVHHAETAKIAQTLLASDPAALDTSVVRRLQLLEQRTDTSAKYVHSLALVERALSAKPDDPELIITKAQILAARREWEPAVSTLGAVLTMPRGTLGPESYSLCALKPLAAHFQADYSLDAAGSAPDAEAKAEWLARAKQAREELIQIISADSPAVLFVDARAAMLGGDYVAAQRKLDEYNQGTNNTSNEGLWLAAEVAQRLNQLGNAQVQLERLIELNPADANPHVALADVLLKLNRPEAARDHLLVAKKGLPENEKLLERIRLIEVQLGLIQTDDPVEAAIFEAQGLATGTEHQIADAAAAVEVLRRAVDQHGPDARLYRYMAQLQLTNGNLEAAAATANEGLTHFPDSEELKRYAVAASGSVEDLVAMIAESDRPEVEKQYAIFQTFARAGRMEEAETALAAAEAADPNSPLILEVLFGRAIEASDVAKAREIAQRAAAADSDRLGGLSFRARLLMLEGQGSEALAAFDEAVRRSPNNAQLWRLRANLQMQLGRTLDAIQSYEHALSIRPDDLQSIMDYCRSLTRLNRLDQALELSRRSEVYGRASPEFMEMLLSLEAEVGNKPGARDRREAILKIRPDDIANRLGLGGLYITLGQWDQARALIDETRAKFGESLALTDLDARWHAERNDLENARRVYASAIANTPPGERMTLYAALARFFLNRGHATPAITTLQQAAAHQPAGVHGMDLLLGDTLMRHGRQREALDAYTRVIAEGGEDEEFSVTKRAAEAAVKIDRLSEAEKLLSTVPNAEADVTVALLRADIALARGQASEARAMLDNAVEEWRDDYRVWIKRAQAEALSEALLPDALADVERALELRPDIAEAHAMLASILMQLGRKDEAIEALTQTVRINPSLEDLRSQLLIILLDEGREAEAMTLANEWFALHPRDVSLRSRVAKTFVQASRLDPAISIYQEAIAIEQRPEMVQRCVELLLGSEPPKLAEAERVLGDARNLVTSTPSLLMARAYIFARTNRVEAAHADCLAAYQLTPHDAESMDRWYNGIRQAYGEASTLLTFLRMLGQQPDGSEWASLFSARAMLDNPPTSGEGLEALRSLIPRTRNVQVRYGALRALSGNRYRTRDFEGAVAAWKEALALKPNDWQVENNLAYVLATDMGRPADALPYAEAAAKHGANVAEAHDTLGAVFLALDRPADAIAPLEAAVRAARTLDDIAKYKTRLAQARLESGDRPGATELIAEVQGWLDRGQTLDDHYKAIFDGVRETLGEG